MGNHIVRARLLFLILPMEQYLRHLSFSSKVGFHFVRVWGVMECCLCFRTFAITSLFLFRGLQVTLRIFKGQSIRSIMFMSISKLRVLFSAIRDCIQHFYFWFTSRCCTRVLYCLTSLLLQEATTFPDNCKSCWCSSG